MEEAVRAAVRFAAERAAETEREDVREIERLLAAFAPGGVTAEALAARRLSARYSVTLRWIPARVLDIRRIDDAWRGPLVRPLAARADRRVGRCSGRIDAAVIGTASRDSVRHFAAWGRHRGRKRAVPELQIPVAFCRRLWGSGGSPARNFAF